MNGAERHRPYIMGSQYSGSARMSWTDVASVANDIVLSESNTSYDKNG